MKWLKKAVGIASVGATMSGCVPSNVDAITTPLGIAYRSDNPSEQLIEHEECHWKKAQEEGIAYFININKDEDSLCQEELRCGATLEHQYCKRAELINKASRK